TGTSTGAGGAAPQGRGGRRAPGGDDRRGRPLGGTQGPGTPGARKKRRAEGLVGGRPATTTAVPAPCVVPKALDLMGRTTSANQSRGPGISEVGLRRIGEMDAQGIDVEAISITPFWYRAARDLAADVIKVNNETLTAWCAAHPDRFLGFASVALQFPDLAVQQLEHAINTLHMCGVAV